MYVALHLLGGFAGDKSREAMQSCGWGNSRKVQEGCVGAALVESGCNSQWFLGPELSPVLGRAQKSLWSLRTDSEDSHGESFFKTQLPGYRVALCHAWIDVAPSGE